MDTEKSTESIEYDSPPIAELELDGTVYRVDAGFRGAMAVSGRATGTWAWSLLAEGKWDGVRFKAKALDRAIVTELERALRTASEHTD